MWTDGSVLSDGMTCLEKHSKDRSDGEAASESFIGQKATANAHTRNGQDLNAVMQNRDIQEAELMGFDDKVYVDGKVEGEGEG